MVRFHPASSSCWVSLIGSGCGSASILVASDFLNSSQSAVLKLKDGSGGMRDCGRSNCVMIG